MLNYDPGVHSHLNLSEYLTPTGTAIALPTIQEGAQGDQSQNGNGSQSIQADSSSPEEGKCCSTVIQR